MSSARSRVEELVEQVQRLWDLCEKLGLAGYAERLGELVEVLNTYLTRDLNRVAERYLYARMYSDVFAVGVWLPRNSMVASLTTVPKDKQLTPRDLWSEMEKGFMEWVETEVVRRAVELLRDIVTHVYTRLTDIEDKLRALEDELKQLREDC